MNPSKEPKKGDLIILNGPTSLTWGLFSHTSGTRTYYYNLSWLDDREDLFVSYEKKKASLLSYMSKPAYFYPEDALDADSLKIVQAVRDLLIKYKYI